MDQWTTGKMPVSLPVSYFFSVDFFFTSTRLTLCVVFPSFALLIVIFPCHFFLHFFSFGWCVYFWCYFAPQYFLHESSGLVLLLSSRWILFWLFSWIVYENLYALILPLSEFLARYANAFFSCAALYLLVHGLNIAFVTSEWMPCDRK